MGNNVNQFISTGQSIRSARRKLNMTQAELAKLAHVSKSTISNYELGYSLPDKYTGVALANALKTNYSEMFKAALPNEHNIRIGMKYDRKKPGNIGMKYHREKLEDNRLAEDSRISTPRCLCTNIHPTINTKEMYMLLFKVIELFGCKIEISDTPTISFNNTKCMISPEKISQYLQDYILVKKLIDSDLVKEDQITLLFNNLIDKYTEVITYEKP